MTQEYEDDEWDDEPNLDKGYNPWASGRDETGEVVGYRKVHFNLERTKNEEKESN